VVNLKIEAKLFTLLMVVILGTVLVGLYAHNLTSHKTEPSRTFNKTANSSSISSTVQTTTSSVETTTILSNSLLVFQEAGLTNGTKWQIKLSTNMTTGGLTKAQTTNEINFTVIPGLYYYTVREVSGYNLPGSYPLRNQGYLNVSNGGIVSVIPGVFVRCLSNCNGSMQTLSFKESGLPQGMNWSVDVDGIIQVSNTVFVNFTEPVSAHTYQISAVSEYDPYPNQARVFLSSGSSIYTTAVTFVK
jgi:hypothetical protein